ncbi:MAG: 6-phosphogluconolactonase [Prevotellaceae bacterium]|jgi:6-phosphogluconolactonase|nr:6-phosphogluconolactonase [Prevotellaceae bacterium]
MKIYPHHTNAETAHALIRHIIRLMEEQPDKIFHLAFSGGTTPSLMFDLWANEYRADTAWKRMRIFWVDERCVPADDSDSNYGTMHNLLLSKVPIAEEYIHPICGANDPQAEALRYSNVVRNYVPRSAKGMPAFDMILLGAGDDGHTASIFPGQEYLLSSLLHPYETSFNPYNGQQRVGMTGAALFNAQRLIFFITGKSKQRVIHDIVASGDTCPAAFVAHHARNVELFTDTSACPSE